jgi:hypothetical protein
MNNMSEIHCEKVGEHAKAMTVEDLQIFLTKVPRKLLVEEINRRLEEYERLESGIDGLIKKYGK